MKKIMFFLLIVTGMVTSAFAINADTLRYLIPYGKGGDTLVCRPGDKIGSKTFVFYVDADQFWRGESIEGIIPFSSHGFKFWGYEKSLRIAEDTLDGAILILSLTLCPPPADLFASVIDPTGGDEDEPSSPPMDWEWYVFIGVVVVIGSIKMYQILSWCLLIPGCSRGFFLLFFTVKDLMNNFHLILLVGLLK